MIDLDAYLQRIGWTGERTPTFATLCGILKAHMMSIPFENLDVLLGRGIRLDLESLEQKLVKARRGGYCFEHCSLFSAVLTQLGFEHATHSARVVLQAPKQASPRGHMFLTVKLDGETFIVDPGFGGLAPTVPLPFVEGCKTRCGQHVHSMIRDGREWKMHVETATEQLDAWISTMDHDFAVDFEMSNHWIATHPASPFVNRILIRALKDDGRVAVMNREVSIYRGTEVLKSQIADRAALRALLVEHFGFDLPEVDRLRVPGIPEWD
jgi:N-hydroxyarylamine O-acetyltransferase